MNLKVTLTAAVLFSLCIIGSRAFSHAGKACFSDDAWAVEAEEVEGVLNMKIFNKSKCAGAPEITIQKQNAQFLMIKNGHILVESDGEGASTKIIAVFRANDGQLFREYSSADKDIEFDGKKLTYLKWSRIKSEDCPKEKNLGLGCYATQKVRSEVLTGKEKSLGSREIFAIQ